MAKTDLTKLPTSPSAIQKVAAKELKKAQKSKGLTYKEGDPSEKVWDTYQLPKGLKRQFKDICSKKNINASKYLRSCIRILVKKEGDLTKAVKAVDKLDATDLVE